MSAEIINPDRYKKTTRKEIEKRKKNNKLKNSTSFKKANSLKYKKEKKSRLKDKNKLKIGKLENRYVSDYEVNIKPNLNVKLKEKSRGNKDKNKKKVKNIYFPTPLKISFAIIGIVVIGFISKKIVKFENMPLISVFSNKENKKELQKEYNLKLGITKLDTTDMLKSRNIVLDELSLLSNARLVEINKDYTINYLAAEKIEKINNKDYIVYLNKEYNLSVDDIKSGIEKLKSLGEESPYYKNIINISSVEEIEKNKSFKISLQNDDPYYIYKLDFPIEVQNNKDNEGVKYSVQSKTDSALTLNKNKSGTSLSTISLNNYQDSDDMVADFRDDKIDMFFASSDLTMQLIGKHEYNVKKYRDGENIFLFGNKDSKLFGLKEVRKALAYSLKREDIIKEVNKSFSELIDLPFIYSQVKYKYDIYGAENELLASGWKKKNGVYTKVIDGESRNLELNLIVKETDETKKKIASLLKEMAQNIGIKINVNILKEKEFNEKMQNKDYDIIIADVFVNQYPDIEFLKEYVNINDVTNNAFSKVYESNSVEELTSSISSLEETLSSEVACIGILARNSNLVYQKYISGFEYTNYLKLFTDLENIGKIIEEK